MLDPDIGNRYWTHRASMEAETYEPSGACPVPPWAGVITRSNPPILASVGPEYPDGDTDPNSSAYVRPGDLYDTERRLSSATSSRFARTWPIAFRR